MEIDTTMAPELIYMEKDVLGLEELKAWLTKPTKPNRLYIGIGLVVLAIYIVYWITSRLL